MDTRSMIVGKMIWRIREQNAIHTQFKNAIAEFICGDIAGIISGYCTGHYGPIGDQVADRCLIPTSVGNSNYHLLINPVVYKTDPIVTFTYVKKCQDGNHRTVHHPSWPDYFTFILTRENSWIFLYVDRMIANVHDYVRAKHCCLIGDLPSSADLLYILRSEILNC